MTGFRAIIATILTLAWVLAATGCAARGGGRAELQSRYPLDRAVAIVRAAERGDADAVHKLVDLLEDADPAVRMYAIGALRRMTGEDFGYQYYVPQDTRAAAVERWRAALREQRVSVRSDGRGRSAAGAPGVSPAALAAPAASATASPSAAEPGDSPASGSTLSGAGPPTAKKGP